jgi:hypothetical protein
MRKIIKQEPSDVIDISTWQPDSEFDPYPKGARAKNAIFSPQDGAPAFIIPDHRYLFKHSSHRYPEQFWIEIIAYFIGNLMDVPVPPAFVAFDSRSRQSGALIEWFYGYPKDQPVRYVEGGDFMVRMIPGYDREKGTQHNFKSISILTRVLMDKGLLAEDGVEYWCKVLTFDALIGNTDRHQDNWGILWKGSGDKRGCVSFSPAFDNGTAMGGEIVEKNFVKFNDPSYLMHYINKGTHHMKWDIRDSARLSHADMLVRLITKYPEKKETMLKSLLFDVDELKYFIDRLTTFKVPLPLSEARAAFITKLIRLRRQLLIGTIESHL